MFRRREPRPPERATTSLSRRRVLELGAASGIAALAGCSGATGSPSYDEWLPASDDGILTAYLDLTLARRTSSIDPLLPLFVPPADGESAPGELLPSLSRLDRIEDPLLRLPLQTGGRIVSVSSLHLSFAGLGDLLDLERPTEGVTELFRANDTVVGRGDVDVREADEALRSGTAGPFGENQFDVVGEDDTYTYYEPSADISGAVGVSESAVLVAETLAAVQAVAHTRRGAHDRATDANDVFGWLFDAAGVGDVAVGWIGPATLEGFYWGNEEPTLPVDVVSQRDSVVSSVSFAPERSEVTAEFALQRPDLGETRRSRLEGLLGTSSEDASVSLEGDRVSATATYGADALDLDFVDPRETTRETTAPGGTEVPQAVAEAVPEGAFEFVEGESPNSVRVNFVETFEADEVTVRATQSGSETSSSTPGPISYLTVRVDPDGDEVVVIVTVDGESGVVARTQVS